MAVLGGAIIGFACLFYAFCLVHFGREMMRSRNKLTCYGPWSANSRGGAVSFGTPEKVVTLRAPQVATAHGRTDAQLAPFEHSAGANINLTYRKSRLTVLPSGTGRLAVKRAAKGSS